MIVHLARKRIDGSITANVMSHQTASLNIHASKIPTFTSGLGKPLSLSIRKTDLTGDDRVGAAKGMFGSGSLYAPPQSEGRHPSNLLIQHTRDCILSQDKRIVKTPKPAMKSINGTNATGNQHSFSEYAPLPGKLYGFGDGEEQMEAWACVPECPARAFSDKLSHSIPRGSTGILEPVDPQENYRFKRAPGGFEDSGNATRFFKQFAFGDSQMPEVIPQELIDYLYKMITPVHVGGESLIALDLNAVDFSTIPDARYHGVIARGEPTKEQTDHLYRIIRPGAHVLLIAPESCPAGYRGACSLEDGGFEIRDAILWATEAEGLHYVPKASTSERNKHIYHMAGRHKAQMYSLKSDLDPEIIEMISQEIRDILGEEASYKEVDVRAIPEDLLQYYRISTKTVTNNKYPNVHPTVKPIAVCKRLLQDIPKDWTVLDPFAGSGTMGIAAALMQVNYIGIEREKEYAEIADARIRGWVNDVTGWIGVEIISEASTLAPPKPKKVISMMDMADD